MKKILALALIVLSSALAFSQEKLMPIVLFSSGDTLTAVMESDIYKITPQTGDTTSEVEFTYKGDVTSRIINIEDSLYATYGTKFLEGTGLGFVINVDYIERVVPVGSNTSTLFYNKAGRIERHELSLSVSDFRALVNAL